MMHSAINNTFYQQKGQTAREMAECQERLYTLRMIKDVEQVKSYITDIMRIMYEQINFAIQLRSFGSV